MSKKHSELAGVNAAPEGGVDCKNNMQSLWKCLWLRAGYS